MCIVKVDSKDKVCYGDQRNKAEIIVGSVNQRIANHILNYDFGVTIMYRNDIVAGIVLKEESKGIYITGRGSTIGDSKSELKKEYSEKYALDKVDLTLDYFYDTDKNTFLGDENWRNNNSELELEKVYVVSFMFDEDKASRIFLMDLKMAHLTN